jgi:cytochrome c oxidase subunit III
MPMRRRRWQVSETAAALAHQFDDSEQQYEASALGMWVFLVTEIMFFGGVFTAYVAYRSLYPQAFGHASNHLDLTLGTINTAVLITSSLTMALAIHAAQGGHTRRLVAFLVLTLLLGTTFLGIKAVEYAHKFEDGLVPGPAFTYNGPDAPHAQIFFSLYFAMTGLHALHMVIGIGILTVLIVMARRGRFGPGYYTPVEMSGLYWHFVDIVWIFLFPLLYLINRR